MLVIVCKYLNLTHFLWDATCERSKRFSVNFGADYVFILPDTAAQAWFQTSEFAIHYLFVQRFKWSKMEMAVQSDNETAAALIPANDDHTALVSICWLQNMSWETLQKSKTNYCNEKWKKN